MPRHEKPEPCVMCGARIGERHKATEPKPTIEELQAWTDEGGCEATDGCWVEPDGTCEHGHSAWLKVLGMI